MRTKPRSNQETNHQNLANVLEWFNWNEFIFFLTVLKKATQSNKTSNTGTLAEVPDISCLLAM